MQNHYIVNTHIELKNHITENMIIKNEDMQWYNKELEKIHSILNINNCNQCCTIHTAYNHSRREQ